MNSEGLIYLSGKKNRREEAHGREARDAEEKTSGEGAGGRLIIGRETK